MDGFTFALWAIGIIVIAALIIVTLAFRGSLSATVRPDEFTIKVSPNKEISSQKKPR